MEAVVKNNSEKKQKVKKKSGFNKRIFFVAFKELLKLVVSFFIARTSIFFTLTPFAPTVMLACGGGVTPFLGSLLGAYTIESFEAVFYIITSYILKFFLKNEKFDIVNLSVSGIIIYTSIISQSDFTPYDIILRFVSVLLSVGSYYPMRTAFKAQFMKSRALKFTKKETYCSIFLFFCLIAGIKESAVLFSVNVSNVFKVYSILICSCCFGMGCGASTGAVIGIMSGTDYKTACIYMAFYSFMGMISGIFSKFSKFTTVLGCLCAYVFSYIYMQDSFSMLNYFEIIVGAAFFLITPKNLLKGYFERYTKNDNTANMLSTVNSIAANRLDSLSKSFFSLSDKINIMPAKRDPMINMNMNSLCDFLSEKVCSKCTLRMNCWDKQFDNTVESLTKAMKLLNDKGELSEQELDPNFSGHCVKTSEIAACCRGFYDILKVNAVWRHKMNENSKAFKQQFIEMSEIICDMKKSIETNKYYEAELSSDIYAAISYEGYIVKDVVVIKDASGAFFVKVTLEHCYEKNNCVPTMKKIIEDVLGIHMVKCDGGCSDKVCSLLFREGSVGKLEKRVYSISKKESLSAGDSYVINRIGPNKYLVALCDGMGTGEEAHEISSCVTGLLTDMLASGFSEEATYRMINSFVIANLSGLGFTTMDFMVIDTKNMVAKIVKKGACPTYIKRNDREILSIENKSLPAGIMWQKPYTKTVHIMRGDIIVMASDGAFDALPDKLWIKNMLTKNCSGNLNECIDLIYSVAQNDCDKQEDDITVLGVMVS